VDFTIGINGQPISVALDQWTDVNPDNVFRSQRFDGYLSEYEKAQGFTLPTRVEAVNSFETDG